MKRTPMKGGVTGTSWLRFSGKHQIACEEQQKATPRGPTWKEREIRQEEQAKRKDERSQRHGTRVGLPATNKSSVGRRTCLCFLSGEAGPVNPIRSLIVSKQARGATQNHPVCARRKSSPPRPPGGRSRGRSRRTKSPKRPGGQQRGPASGHSRPMCASDMYQRSTYVADSL